MVKNLLLFLIFSIFLFVSCSNNNKDKERDTTFDIVADTLRSSSLPDVNKGITDYEKIFTNAETSQIYEKCLAFEKKNKIPISIFTNDNIGDFDNFTQYSDAISEKWNGCINNQGLIFVISNKLGEIRLISCSETEKMFSDDDFNYLINEIIFNEFKQNEFSAGLLNSMDFLDKKIK